MIPKRHITIKQKYSVTKCEQCQTIYRTSKWDNVINKAVGVARDVFDGTPWLIAGFSICPNCSGIGRATIFSHS